MKIEELKFSVRVYNCLKRAGIDTVEQLKWMSDEDLMCLRNFGTTCLAEVRQKVAWWRKFKKPTMNNGDRIRAMTDEELAAVILCPKEISCLDECLRASCVECSKQWLQQPAEEKENESTCCL